MEVLRYWNSSLLCSFEDTLVGSFVRFHGELEIPWVVFLSFVHVFLVLDVLDGGVLFYSVQCVQFRTVFASNSCGVVLLRCCQNGNNYPTSRVGFSFFLVLSEFIPDGFEEVVDAVV